MRRLIGLWTLIASLALPVAAFAQSTSPHAKVHYFKNLSSTNQYNVLESKPLNGLAATLLYTADIGSVIQGGWDGYSYGKLLVKVKYVRGSGTATHVNVVVSCSHDGEQEYFQIASRSCSAGACKDYLMTDKNEVDGLVDDEDASAGNESYRLEYDVKGEFSCKIQASGTGAAAADLYSLQVVLSVGG